MLAEELAGRRSALGNQEPKRLLELGCGCGLAVLAALAAGYEVTAIDYYSVALDFVRINAARIGFPCRKRAWLIGVSIRAIWWAFDLVVAADVLYERDYCRLMAQAFKQSLRAGGLGILTDPQRSKAETFRASAGALD